MKKKKKSNNKKDLRIIGCTIRKNAQHAIIVRIERATKKVSNLHVSSTTKDDLNVILVSIVLTDEKKITWLYQNYPKYEY